MPPPARKAKARKGAARAAIRRPRSDPAAGKLAAAQAAYKEALEQQAATADILKVISGSTTDIQPVFDMIVERAVRLCGARFGRAYRYDGSLIHMVAGHGLSVRGLGKVKSVFPRPPSDDTIVGQVIIRREPWFVHDIDQAGVSLPELSRQMIRALGTRSQVTVPMLHSGKPIGALTIGWDQATGFDERKVELLKTFADQAVIVLENARLFNETKEALEQQTTTSEVLKAISRSTFDLDAVLRVLIANAARLAGATQGFIFRFDGECARLACAHNAPESYRELIEANPIRPGRGTLVGRTLAERKPVHIPDVLADPEFSWGEAQRRGGFRSMLGVPMLREGDLIGVIAMWNSEVRPFTDRQMALASSFADQAVIAIENVRLFNETKEALERQTATAEILKVISSSTTDTQPVFEAIVRSAVRLFPVTNASIFMRDGNLMRLHAVEGAGVDDAVRRDLASIYPIAFDPEVSTSARAMVERRINICLDTEAPGVPEHIRRAGRAGRFRSNTVVPLVRYDEGIGTIVITYPQPGHQLNEKQLAMLRTFADQAVIAIENTRLFNETKEALEQQTATGEILNVISSSPTDLKPVFDTILANATRLCDAQMGILGLYDGAKYQTAAHRGANAQFARWLAERGPWVPPVGGPMARMIDSREPVHVEDMTLSDAYRRGEYIPKTTADLGGARTYFVVPMLKDDRVMGGIAIYRTEVRPFSNEQIDLVRSFANQAVIAIENVRLFNETKEALEQQTAISEVLRAISASPTDVTPVLEAVAQRATKICEASDARIFLVEGAEVRHAAGYGDIPINRPSFPLDRGTVTGRAVIDRAPVQVEDLTQAADEFPRGMEIQRRTGHRTVLGVPLMREDRALGAIVVRRMAVKPFTEKQVDLLKTFADQAAIAIENVRLFHEIQEKSRQLEEASKHKSQFLASMSHELRTPLNAILGFNEMIIGGIYGDVPPDMTEPLRDIQTSGKHLLRLINNVLDLAKIEAGRMELALADYSVQDTVAGVHATLRPLAAEKGLGFVTRVPQDIPLAHGDAGRLAQCLMNLAGNSLKFTKSGQVEIAVAHENARLRYQVSDTGIGIPADKLASLFTEFKQTDATVASEYGGTGLGLSITKKFIEMHGGRVWVESEVGKGSSFIFEIPLRAGE